MDRLRRAEAALAAAARSPAVLVPGRVTSPMDCCITVPVAREVIDACWAQAGPALRSESDSASAVVTGQHVVMDAEMRRLAAGAPPARRRGTA